ncbi:MAG: hypothetical protein WC805_01750 [Patescibacteria group bacterium]|jgi:hypothetical protein
MKYRYRIIDGEIAQFQGEISAEELESIQPLCPVHDLVRSAPIGHDPGGNFPLMHISPEEEKLCTCTTK